MNMLAFSKTHLREIGLVALIAVFSFGTHFYRFDYPQEIVFDEVHFAGFTSNYLADKYYFDIHPPLAKIMLAEFTKLRGLKQDPAFEYKSIGDEFTNKEFHTAMRLLVTSFGFLFPILIYFFTRVLFQSPFAAFIAGFLAVFENSLIIHSRYILTDIFLLNFGILGLIFYLLARQKTESVIAKYSFFLLAGIFLGASVSVKWTALVFVGLVGLLALYDLSQNKKLREFLLTAASVLGAGFAVYVIAFAIHLNALSNTGPGDAFMTPEFQATLAGNTNSENTELKKPGFGMKFVELNIVMFVANKGITAEHSYGSDWYSWPFLGRSVYYWNKTVADPQIIDEKFQGISPEISGDRHVEERLYLLGNPIIYWFGFAIMAFLTFHILAMLYTRTREIYLIPLALLCIGYWVNMLPYAAISRVSFLYHYFPSLVFLFAGTGFLFWRYCSEGRKLIVPGIFLGLVIIAYIFFFPLTYGLPLTNTEYDHIMFIQSWK